MYRPALRAGHEPYASRGRAAGSSSRGCGSGTPLRGGRGQPANPTGNLLTVETIVQESGFVFEQSVNGNLDENKLHKDRVHHEMYLWRNVRVQHSAN